MGVESGSHSLASWRKSTFSADSGNCVEISTLAPSVFVRDSQNLAGPVLKVNSALWVGFLQRMRDQGSTSIR